MRLRRILIFLGTAIGLSLVWFGTLMIPWVTRKTLVSFGWERGLLVFVSVAVILAGIMWRAVIRERTPERSTLMALGVPFIGAILFMSALMIWEWFKPGIDQAPGSVGDALFSIGLVAVATVFTLAWKAFYVVIPMGALTIYVMRKVGDALWPELKPHQG